MGDKTGISWTDATWNPVRGCTRVSEGCRNCYAETMAARIVRMGGIAGEKYRGLVRLTEAGEARWTGDVAFDAETLTQPLRWKRPRRIFVNSMSDMFHENLTDEQIAEVFAVMATTPRHTYQVLTKRAERMSALMTRSVTGRCVKWGGHAGRPLPDCNWLMERAWQKVQGHYDAGRVSDWHWPLPNVWLGVSAEDQPTLDARVPLLRQCPAAVRWVSLEPLLEEVDVAAHVLGDRRLDWIVIGGESGRGARPFDPRWARKILAQCAVPVFVKQLGSRPVLLDRWDVSESRYHDLDAAGWDEHQGSPTLRDRKGEDPSEWSEDLRVQQWPETGGAS